MAAHRFKMTIAALVASSVCLVLAAHAAMAGKWSGAHEPGGAWVAKVDGFPGQWSYVVAADPSGKRASGHGNVEVGLNLEAIRGPAFEPADHISPLLIEIALTEQNAPKHHCMHDGLRTPGLSSPVNAEIVYIAVVTAGLKFTAPGKAKATHNFEMYYPSQDKHGDGFPDADETTPYAFQQTLPGKTLTRGRRRARSRHGEGRGARCSRSAAQVLRSAACVWGA